MLLPAVGFADDQANIDAWNSAKDRMEKCLHQLPKPGIQTEDKFAKLTERYAAACGREFKQIAWMAQRDAFPTWSSSQVETAAQAWATMEVTTALGCEFIDPDDPEGTRSVYCTGSRR